MHPRNEDTTRPDVNEPSTFAEEDEADARLADVEPRKGKRETDRELDHGLKETFPASDPVSINPGAD